MTYKIFLVPLLAAALVLSVFLWHDTNGPSGTQAPPPPSAHEAAPVAIRIGYLHPDSAIANSIDVRHFYGQHLTELAKYLDWTYELVEIPPQEAVERLKRHDVDLLLPMEVNPQRQDELVYSKHAFFLDTLALYTREDEERFHSHDISKLDGASVGLYENRLINDILRDFAHSLIRLTRHRDIVGRFGGDEFVLYLRNIPEPALHAFAQRLMTAAHNLDPVQKPPLSASIGIALINQPGLSYEEVFHKADRALYDVKESGRDGYKIYEN